MLPVWVEYLRALGTPMIAVLVGYIAYRQWRTAHQRVVLDLFDKRVHIVEELRTVVAEILQGGKVSNEDSTRFLRATRGADFLFGKEVTNYLDRIFKVLLDLHVCDEEREMAAGEERQGLFKERRKLRDELNGFFKKVDALVAPYVRMHQKL